MKIYVKKDNTKCALVALSSVQTFFLHSDNLPEISLLPLVLFYFRQAVHNAVNKQLTKPISCLLGESSNDLSLCRIIEVSSRGTGVLTERILTEIPFIKWCRMVQVASKLPFIGVLITRLARRR